jgi:hypothetical protein
MMGRSGFAFDEIRRDAGGRVLPHPLAVDANHLRLGRDQGEPENGGNMLRRDRLGVHQDYPTAHRSDPYRGRFTASEAPKQQEAGGAATSDPPRLSPPERTASP